ncbi:hypothetical protein Dimus_006545 [Dionaea muscipula]
MGGRKGWPKDRPRNPNLGDSSVRIARGVNQLEQSEKVLGDSSERSARGVNQLEQLGEAVGLFRVSWAKDCEAMCPGTIDVSSQSLSCGPWSDDYLDALTHDKVGEASGSNQSQKKSMEGNRALCNGLKVSYIDRRTEELVITEED